MFKAIGGLFCALAFGAMLPSAAQADDPQHSMMHSATARARDSADTKLLNQNQLAYVRQRDEENLQAARDAQSKRDVASADARAEYERKMAAWRRAVSECNAGHREYCAN